MAKRSRTSKQSAKNLSAKKSSSTSNASTRKSGKARAATRSRASEDAVPGAMSDEQAREALAASEKLYYRIGEVSQLTGVKAHVLRYWETEFRWMAPPKSRSKQRLYRKRDIEFVWLLKRLLWDERYTIAGARQRIADLGVEDALKILSQPAGKTSTLDARPPESIEILPAGFAALLAEMKSELSDLRAELVDA